MAAAAAQRGLETVGLVRAGSPRKMLGGLAVRVEEGTFHDPAAAQRLLRRIRPDAIIHCAAVVSSGTPDLNLSWRVNVEGTGTLAREARRRGVLRFIHISSMSAHPGNKAVYGATKLASEDGLRQTGMRFTILRPSLIYGPAKRGIFYKMTRLVAGLPVVPLVGGGKEPVRPVHAEDVAAAALEAIEADWAQGNTYELGGPEDWTLRDMIVAMRRLMGKRPLTFPLPLPLCRIGAAVGETLLREPPLTTDNLEGIARARRFTIDAARRDLAFNPRSFDEGFRQCLEAGILQQKSRILPHGFALFPDESPKHGAKSKTL